MLLVVGASALIAACDGGDSATAPAPAPSAPTPPAPAPAPQPPATPAGLRVAASGDDFIEWSWNASEGADGYDVQFSPDEVFNATDEIIGRTAEELSYRRQNLASGTSAVLRVRSAAGTGENRITSAWSDPVTGSTTEPRPPAVPGSLRVSASGEGFIEWSWDASEGADGYDVQFSPDEVFDATDEIVGRTAEELSYRRENLAAGTSSYLRVRSAAGTGGDRITSAWSAPVTGSTTLLDGPHAEHHAALTAGLPERPFVNATVGSRTGSKQTVGTLRLGVNADAFPVIVMPSDIGPRVLVAGSGLGAGRIVAFSGRDFLSPRTTLLENANAARLLANAVRWAGSHRRGPLRVLADSEGVADVLARHGLSGVKVVGTRGRYERDWSADALDDADVAVVQINESHRPHLVGESVAPLRMFVERGGGLIVAGAALHWSWWLEQELGRFTGNSLLHGAGIAWNEDSVPDIKAATTDVDLDMLPSVVWAAYVGGHRTEGGSVLSGAFNSALELGRTEELDAALRRLVSETPPLPVPADDPQAWLAAEVAETLGPYEWPETHPWAATFPGLPDRNARRATGSVSVDATGREFPADARRRERRFPLGFYAPPGGLVTISVPSLHVTDGLAIEAGQDHDDLRHPYYAEHNPDLRIWRRAPALRRLFWITATETGVTNAFGGSLSLVVPEHIRDAIPVTVEGAIPMAVYTAARSSLTEWRADLNAGAPQAIIQTLGGIRLVLSAENARDISAPGEVAAFWDGFQQRHAELAGEPVPRAYESIWQFDPQVGWGYANAGWDRINYPLHGEHWVLLPGTAAGRAYLSTLRGLDPPPHRVPPSSGYVPREHGVDWWLFGHELGHQWQTDDWTGHGITEVGVNLFTMYTLNHYVFGGGEFNVTAETPDHGCAAPLDHAALAAWRWSTVGDCEKLALYRQLISEFGWTPMRRVFHSYYDPAYPRQKYGSDLDGFAIRFSWMVQRDLADFFRRWEYPLSGSAEATIRGFGFAVWLPPGW